MKGVHGSGDMSVSSEEFTLDAPASKAPKSTAVPKTVAVSDNSDGSLGGSENGSVETPPGHTADQHNTVTPDNQGVTSMDAESDTSSTAARAGNGDGSAGIDDSGLGNCDCGGISLSSIDKEFSMDALAKKLDELNTGMKTLRERTNDYCTLGDEPKDGGADAELIGDLISHIETLQEEVAEWMTKAEEQYLRYTWCLCILQRIMGILDGLFSSRQILLMLLLVFGTGYDKMRDEIYPWKMGATVRASLSATFIEFGRGYTSLWRHVAWLLGYEECSHDPARYIFQVTDGTLGAFRITDMQFLQAIYEQLREIFPSAPVDLAQFLDVPVGMTTSGLWDFLHLYRRRVQRRLEGMTSVTSGTSVAARRPAHEVAREEAEDEEEEDKLVVPLDKCKSDKAPESEDGDDMAT